MGWDSTIISGFRAGIVAIRRDGVVAYINPIGMRILEGSPLAVGDKIQDKAGENSFFWMLGEAISLDYLSTRVETYLTDKNGEPMRLGFTLSELKEGDRKVGICAFFKDLRHVEMDEENENVRQRLLLLEHIGAGLAGEITNPVVNLGIVRNMLLAQAAQAGITLTALPMMEEEISRLENVIRECHGFLQPVKLSPQEAKVDAIIEEIVAKLAALHAGMEFKVHKPEGMDLSAEVDAGLLAKALTSIVANAVDACEAKGGLEITFALSRHFSDLVRLDREVRSLLPGHSGKEEEFLRIVIRNNGPGIPGGIRDRIFVPFYSTKKSRGGIGLPVAQKIISAHGGILEFGETAKKGGEFSVKIPIKQKR